MGVADEIIAEVFPGDLDAAVWAKVVRVVEALVDARFASILGDPDVSSVSKSGAAQQLAKAGRRSPVPKHKASVKPKAPVEKAVPKK